MSNIKIYKCGFKHCKHESIDLSQDEAVKVGNRYMHEDCAKINKNIAEIRDLYCDEISDTVVIKQLVGAINYLVFNKNIDSDYLLYSLKYAIKNKIRINSPYGLNHLVDDFKIKESWKKIKAYEMVEKINKETTQCEPTPMQSTFTYIKDDSFGFGDLLKGGL